MSFAVIGSAEQIRDLLCGPQQHNEHCKGWRWHLYVQDNEKRFQNVMAELRKMHAERRAREAFLEASDLDARMAAPMISLAERIQSDFDHARVLRKNETV